MKQIIIIDDNEEFLNEISEALKIKGYRVNAVTTAREGLKLIKEDNPDLVLLDLKLRHTTGFKVAETLREDKDIPDIPIIAMTGHFSKEDQEYAESIRGIKTCITKPFDPEKLFREIEKVVYKEKN